MFAPFKISVGARSVALALALAASSFSAQAVLERAGPVSLAPNVGGFPTWYQDTTGLALEFCSPKNMAELNGGWCLLLPPDITVVPEMFPSNFFDEHFFFAAGAGIGTRQLGGKANIIIGLEGAFGTTVSPGENIAFARIRVVLNPLPLSGTYRFIHPYGEEVIDGVEGQRIFFSDDFGATCGLNFNCALNGRMGPFLLPSATPGGAEMPALTAANPIPDSDPTHWADLNFAPTPYPGTGNSYIADPAREGPVTGSALPDFMDSSGNLRNHNIWRIEGPLGSGLGIDPVTGAIVDWIETTNFSLMGRVFAGGMPGRVAIDRATYTRSPADLNAKLDVFATAIATTQGRLPAGPKPIPGVTTMTFFDQPCAGTVDVFGTIHPPFSGPLGAVETPMRSAGNLQWAQTNPAILPTSVCVKDASARDVAGNIVPLYASQAVTDEVPVVPALFNPNTGTMTVGATSSDTVLAPTLNVAYPGYAGDLVTGQIVVPGMIAPPSSVFVQSSALGATRYQVSTGFGGAVVGTSPVAINDPVTVNMNYAGSIVTNVLPVLLNDTNAVGGTVTLTSQPAFGIAVVNPDGTVSYTPNVNASGTDAFTYTVTVGAQVSNAGIATLTITPTPLAPVAVNDTINGIANLPLAINVIANDTDPNGAATVTGAVNVTQPTPAGASTSVAGGIVNFNATAPGAYTFTYQAADAGGLISANTATVTVQVAAAETLGISSNLYIIAKKRLTVAGTIAPIGFQTVRLDFVNGLGAVVGTVATIPSTVLGGWSIDTVIPLPAGTVSLKATTSNGTVKATLLILK